MEKSPWITAGERLRELLTENNMTQEEFADEYFTDVRTISRYINNGIKNLEVIQRLADYFGVGIEYFLK